MRETSEFGQIRTQKVQTRRDRMKQMEMGTGSGEGIKLPGIPGTDGSRKVPNNGGTSGNQNKPKNGSQGKKRTTKKGGGKK